MFRNLPHADIRRRSKTVPTFPQLAGAVPPPARHVLPAAAAPKPSPTVRLPGPRNDMEHLGDLLPPGPAERFEEEFHVARGLLSPPRRTKQMTDLQ